MANFSFPLQFLRQYAGPLDYDGVFATTAERIAYLTSARRYAGQVVADTQDGNIYVLSSDTNSWINVCSKYLPLSAETFTVVQSNSANWSSVYSNVNSNSANAASVYSSVMTASANWDVVYADFKRLSSTFLTTETGSQTLSFNDSSKQLTISNGNTISLSALDVSNSVTLTGTQTLTNKTIVDWMTLVRGYKTIPTLNATIATGDVYTYVYNSSPSDKTYYRFIASDGSEDTFYTYFSGNTLSGIVARKSITL